MEGLDWIILKLRRLDWKKKVKLKEWNEFLSKWILFFSLEYTTQSLLKTFPFMKGNIPLFEYADFLSIIKNTNKYSIINCAYIFFKRKKTLSIIYLFPWKKNSIKYIYLVFTSNIHLVHFSCPLNIQTKGVKAILKSANSTIPITVNPQPHCPVEYLHAYKSWLLLTFTHIHFHIILFLKLLGMFEHQQGNSINKNKRKNINKGNPQN